MIRSNADSDMVMSQNRMRESGSLTRTAFYSKNPNRQSTQLNQTVQISKPDEQNNSAEMQSSCC